MLADDQAWTELAKTLYSFLMTADQTTDNAFQRLLKSVLVERGISQTDIAKGTQVSRTTVNKWKSGVSIPPPELVSRFLNFIGEDESVLSDLVRRPPGRPLP